MPLDYGCRLDQDHRVENRRPNPIKPNPEKPVHGKEPKPTWAMPPKDAHLIPQANQLELQGGTATKAEGQDGNDSRQKRDHACEARAVALKSPEFLPNSEF